VDAAEELNYRIGPVEVGMAFHAEEFAFELAAVTVASTVASAVALVTAVVVFLDAQLAFAQEHF